MTNPRRVDEVLHAAATLALWREGDLEPTDQKYVEESLDALYELCVFAERAARDKYPDWS